MKIIILLSAFLGLALSAGSQLCSSYYCDEFPGTSGISQPEWYFCAERLQSRQLQAANTANIDFFTTYLLGACPQDSKHTICNLGNMVDGQGTFCTPTAAPKNLLPGQTCSDNSECLSTKCTDGKCVGLGEGMSCDATSKCDVGFFCKSSTCTKVAALDDSCDNNTPCDPRYICTSGSCSKFFSVPTGTKPATEDIRACTTGFLDASKTCAEGPTRQNAKKTNTKAETGICQYTTTGTAISAQPSVCSMSATPAAYCKIGAGDKEFQDVLTLANEFISRTDVPQCHVNLAMGCDAAMALDKRGALALSYLTTWIDEYASMEGAPDCVLWSIKPEQHFVMTGSYPQKPGSNSNSGAVHNFAISAALVIMTSLALII